MLLGHQAMHDYLNVRVLLYVCVCVWGGTVHTQLYQDKETERLSESKAAIKMPAAGKC